MQKGAREVLADLGIGIGNDAISRAATENHGHPFNRYVSNCA